MTDLTVYVDSKLPASLDSRAVVFKLNEIRGIQRQVEKRHDHFLRDLDEEIGKIRNEINSPDLGSTDYSDLHSNTP